MSETPHEPSRDSGSSNEDHTAEHARTDGTEQADSRDDEVQGGQHAESGPRSQDFHGSEQPITSTRQARNLPSSLTFRITPISVLAVITVAICVSPIAWAHPWLLSLYLIPVLLLFWILRSRTVVDANRISVRTMLRSTNVSWDDVRWLRLDERRWLRAVLVSGKEIRLPAVRLRDLPRVAAMSSGRLSDPTTEPPEPDSSEQ